MQIKFEILKRGDTVLNVWENHIAVKKKSGKDFMGEDCAQIAVSEAPGCCFSNQR